MEKFFAMLLSTVIRFSIFTVILLMTAKHQACSAVEIKRLSVPRWIQNGTEKSVILDCEYIYNENDLRLVVKWFFEDNLEPVYQWIPELNRRHISGVLLDRLDLDFAVNTADTYSRLRALKIKEPSTELSGRYTCLVTSLAGQDTKEQVMTVFVPAKDFELLYIELSDSSVNVTCKAQRLYPQPVLKLYLGTSGNDPVQPVTEITLHSEQIFSGAYNALLYRTFSASELPSSGASVFECSLELPGTNYVRAKRIAYYPGTQGLRIDAAHSLSSASHRISVGVFYITGSISIVFITRMFFLYVYFN